MYVFKWPIKIMVIEGIHLYFLLSSLVIIKSEVANFPIVVFFHGYVSEVVARKM